MVPLLLVILLANFKDVAEAASLGNDTTFEMENSNDNLFFGTRADVVKCDDQTPCPPYANKYKNECVLGVCIRCTKYHEVCSRTEEGGLSPCCKTAGKEDVLCRKTEDQGSRETGICDEDPCAKHKPLLSGYGKKGVYNNAKRCDFGYGKKANLYHYICVGKVCTECGGEGAPCQSDAECCNFATCQADNKKKVCKRKCGDQGWICTDRPKYCCKGLSCAVYESGGGRSTKYNCV